jgi:hypothetical protein
VHDPKIKWPIAGSFFIIGIIVGLIYFLYFYKRAQIVKAVSSLSAVF